jgi:dTDP-4-dehydrorhamnose reductase
MKILVLGANGMLGNACMNYFYRATGFRVSGTIRSGSVLKLLQPEVRDLIIPNIEIVDPSVRQSLFESERPDIVINCIGLVKQAKGASDTARMIALNSLLPHQLAKQCDEFGSRLIHVSTDCVFSGLKGSAYLESDISDANDLYGRSKFLGEIANKSNVLTIRTSIIGNELQGSNGLLEWFLAQGKECQGFTKAIYSGLPTIILMQLIENVLLKRPSLSGLYQAASFPISKYNLLQLIARIFKKQIEIVPNDSLIIDRSLDGSRFSGATGFIAPAWEEMVKKMYLDRIANVQK